MQLDLTLFILLYIFHLQCFFESVLDLFLLLTLQDSDLRQCAEALPNSLFGQPDTPLFGVLC